MARNIAALLPGYWREVTQSLLRQMLLLDIVSHNVICSTGRKPVVPVSQGLVLALFLIYSAMEVQSKWRESTDENIPLFFLFFPPLSSVCNASCYWEVLLLSRLTCQHLVLFWDLCNWTLWIPLSDSSLLVRLTKPTDWRAVNPLSKSTG